MNFKHLIDLVASENSKIYVVDESGEVKLVIMGPQDFAQLQGIGVKTAEPAVDPEEVNREIVEAQLHEELPPVPLPTTTSHISQALSDRAKRLFKSVPADLPLASAPRLDLRSEVIDPSFDFDAPTREIEEI